MFFGRISLPNSQSTHETPRRLRRATTPLIALITLLALSPQTNAANKSWNQTNATNLWGTTGNWVGGTPVSGDDVFITNAITDVTGVLLKSITAPTSGNLNSLTVSNSTSFFHQVIVSNSVLNVSGTTLLGKNANLVLGGQSAGQQASGTVSTANMYLTDNAVLSFGNGSINANMLTVTGVFSNDVSTFATNTGGMAIMKFTSTSNIVTNMGTMSILVSQAGSTATGSGTGLVLQVGTDATANTFYNKGTALIGNKNGTRSTYFAFSNQFVNGGTFAVTNTDSGGGIQTLFYVTGIAGTSLTNEAAGTIKLAASSGSGVRNVMTLNSGGFVNLGTLTSDTDGTAANRSNQLFLASGQTFSNAAGGQVIAQGRAGGEFVISADKIINVGTNVINAGTLDYLTSAGGAAVLENAGTILFGGANLNVGTLTNKATGTIKATAGANAIVGSLLVNNGTIDISGTTILSNATAGTTWTNSATGRLLLNAASLTGGQVHNLGTVNSTGGLDIFRSAPGATVTNDLGGTYVVGGAAMRFSTAFTESGSTDTFYNGGTFIFNAGTIAVGSFVNTNTFNVAHSGTGTITAGGGYVFSNAASAHVVVNSGTVVYTSGGLDNLGVITAYGNGVFGNSGPDFTNKATGVIISTNSGTTLGIRSSVGSFVNLGSVVVSNGATINWLQSNGTGNTLSNSAGSHLVVGSATSDGVFNSATIANSGNIDGSGTLNLAIATGGHPLINLSSGTISNLDNRTLTVTNVSGTAFSQVVIVDAQTNLFNIYNSGTTVVGSGTSQLRFASGTNSAGNNFSLSMLNTGTVQMNGGSLSFATPTASVVSNLGGWIQGAGTIAGAGIDNTGTILANGATPLNLTGPDLNNFASGVVTANSARLLVSGVFTNQGTVNLIHSVATFNSAVVNSGAWITDPTTNVFNNTFTVTSSGSVSAAAGDVYTFKKDFVNQSTQSNTWNTLNVTPGSTADGTKFLFSGDGTSTQQFFHGGLLLTGGFVGTPASPTDLQLVSSFSAVTGFNTNFALGNLDLTNTTVLLSQVLPGSQTNALFVNTLDMLGTSDLVISSNMIVYFIYSNNWSTANVSLLGNAEIHQLSLSSVVPEPGVLLLWLSGAVTVYGARRRRLKK